MKRVHAMPFGAQVEDGGVRFALWAPTAQEVALVLGDREIAMPDEGEGWRRITVPEARAGDRYGFRIDGGMIVPDPASRFQPDDVHEPGLVVDPSAYEWNDAPWTGRPWDEAVLYEVHVGTATAEGTYAGLAARLHEIRELGVTALQIMPIADFAGARNWGYDGVLPFTPDAAYGTPDDLKRLIDLAHGFGLMVMLDVVYNHFGPCGNYLNAYAGNFFTERHPTPWGAGVNVDGRTARPVRDFFVHNALYWLEEYHFDGLRLDAVHEIRDDGNTHLLAELAERVRAALPGREIHLVLENDANEASRLDRDDRGRPRHYTAQWNDDLHHTWHAVLTGEDEGYYADYAVPVPEAAQATAEDVRGPSFETPPMAAHQDEVVVEERLETEQPHVPPHSEEARRAVSKDGPQAPSNALAWLGRSLSQGFAYQGEASPHREGRARGESSAHLPPAAFIAFLQNHDQVGNRAFGERLSHLVPDDRLALARAALLLAPHPPMLFMGEEWSASTPFLYFVDFADDPGLSKAVRNGRRREFGRFRAFSDPVRLAEIPDPTRAETMERSRLDWSEAASSPHAEVLGETRELLALRREHVLPLLKTRFMGASHTLPTPAALDVIWRYGKGDLRMVLNTGDAALEVDDVFGWTRVWSSAGAVIGDTSATLPAWCGVVLVSEAA